MSSGPAINNPIPSELNSHRSGDGEVTVEVDREALEAFWREPLNDPGDIRIKVEFEEVSDTDPTQHEGELEISFVDSAVTYEAGFVTGKGKGNTVYNTWFKKKRERVFHAIFQDEECPTDNETAWDGVTNKCVGGLVFVIDQMIDDGDDIDDLDHADVGGAVWYKNFPTTRSAHPPKRCWFVSLGPFDCRPWLGHDHTDYVHPHENSGYRKFVSFYGLRLDDIFGNEFSFKDVEFAKLNPSGGRSIASVETSRGMDFSKILILSFGVLLLSFGLLFLFFKLRSKKEENS